MTTAILLLAYGGPDSLDDIPAYLLDIRGGTDITISWSHFHTHKKVTLAWQDAGGQPAGGMRVTWHHNHFDRTTVRNPRFHYGIAHLYNNVWDAWWQYGASSYDGARMLTEANVFAPADDCVGIPGVLPCDDMNPCGDDGDWAVNRQLAVVSAGEGNAPGFVRSVGDVVGGQGVIQVNGPERVPDPPYAAPVEAAGEALAARVRAGAGPRVDWRE